MDERPPEASSRVLSGAPCSSAEASHKVTADAHATDALMRAARNALCIVAQESLQAAASQYTEVPTPQTTLAREALLSAAQEALRDAAREALRTAVSNTPTTPAPAVAPPSPPVSMSSSSVMKEEKTRYVLSGQPTGWAAMAQVVREFDQEKVQDCKEDVDTLLVFAGLFSAILSAFLIATYPNLQQAFSNQTLQVASQADGDTAGSSTSNPTAPSITSPPFEPSANNIRLNTCWFASLVISLITASFGILVKQWLRAFMAVDNPSPQARLRVRHVRYPELLRWRICKFAAALPLLLQFALGLFFVGLCDLTSSIHPTIASTTLALVTIWGVFYVGITLMPVAFPRCPFKTVFLKDVLLFTRRIILLSVYLAHDLIVRLRLLSLMRPRKNTHGLFRDAVSRAFRGDDHEKDAVSTDAADADILAAVDAIQSNDELLATTIKDSLLQTRLSLSPCLRFVTTVLRNRLRSAENAPDTTYPVFTDSALLSKKVKMSIIDILCPAIAQTISNSDRSSKPQDLPYATALVVALSLSSSGEIPLHVSDVVRAALVAKGPPIWGLIASMCCNSSLDMRAVRDNSDTYAILFKALVRVQKELRLSFEEALEYFETICKTVPGYFRRDHHVLNVLPHWWARCGIWEEHFSHLTVREFRRAREPGGDALSPRIHHALIPLFRAEYITDSTWTELVLHTSHRSARLLVRTVLASISGRWLRGYTTQEDGIYRAVDSSGQDAGCLFARFVDSLVITTNNFPAVIDDLKADGTLPFEAKPITELLKLCSFLILCAVLPRSIQDKAAWDRLFKAILNQIDAHPATAPTQGEWATRCLRAIEYVEYTTCGCDLDWYGNFKDEGHHRWSSWYSPEKTVFSDSTVERLARLGSHPYVERRRGWNVHAESLAYSATSGDHGRRHVGS